MGICLEKSHLVSLATAFGCKVGDFPTKYLGLPLCLGMPKKSLWDPLVERVERRLSSWKSRYPSLGGRLSVLLSLRLFWQAFLFTFYPV